MSFKVTEALRKLSKLKKRKRVVQGGTWAGKTYDIIALEIDYLIKNPNENTTVIAETIPSIKKGALKDFIDIMMETNRFVPNRYNGSDRMYKFANGSTIEFTSFDTEEKARQAGKRNRLFINEANTIPYPICDALIIRTDDVIWLDYNPVSAFWVHNEWIGKDDVDFINLTYRDNEALPDSILKELMLRREKAKTSSYWKNWCDVYLDGKLGSIEGVCIPEWEEINLPDDARLLCYGMDFGYSNDPTTLVAMYKYNDGYIFDEVIYQKGLLNSDISNLLKTYEIQEYIYADSAEPKSIDELSYYGHRVLPVTKGRDSIVYGLNLINQNNIYITSRSKNLITELRNYTWQKDKEGNTINKPIDAFNHAIDAMRYAAMEQLKDPNRGIYHIY